MCKKQFNLNLAKVMMQKETDYARSRNIIYGPGNVPLFCLGDYEEKAEEIIGLLQAEGFTINEA